MSALRSISCSVRDAKWEGLIYYPHQCSTQAENWQRKCRQIRGQVGGLSDLSLHVICILSEKNSLPSSDSPHPLLCPLHLGQLEGHSSSRTFRSNRAGTDLEVLAPTWSTGEMLGDMVPELPVMDESAIILDIISFLLCLLAVLSNGLVTAAPGVQWLLWRALSPCDTLLISLGASRFCLQWVVVGERIYVFLCPKATPYNPVLHFLALQWDFFNAATFWFSSWLSVFYCVKIATLAHQVFLRLKRKVSGPVPWMLLSSGGLSALSTILFFVGNQSTYQKCLRRGPQSRNVTETLLGEHTRNSISSL